MLYFRYVGDNMGELEEYMNQDIMNPKYLFHGSASSLDVIEPRKSSDNVNKDNEYNAVFLTSWFINAAAYAFSRKLERFNEHWSFSMNNNGTYPAMEFEVEYIPDNLYAYVHVFEKTDDMVKDKHENTTQYRCYHDLVPTSIIRVDYKDFKEYFSRKETVKKWR